MGFVLGDAVVFPGKGVGIIVGEGVSEIRGKKGWMYTFFSLSNRELKYQCAQCGFAM